ncbi:MAG TPA: calcium/sodium antiporter [Bacteroidales bacterium]|nr:calcium/sodium antiporter [Bacteroidales bacterium]
MIYILFIVGFVLLIAGARYFVDGAVSMGIRARLSPLVIGLTVVAFGTSLPELVVNIFAAFKGSTGLAIGNVLGSNIVNILGVIGITALIFPFHVDRPSMRRDLPFGIFVTFLLLFMGNGYFLGFAKTVTRLEGLLMLLIFGAYLAWLMRSGDTPDEASEYKNKQADSIPVTALMLIGGLAGMYFGGEWVSDGAIHIANVLGISEGAIGLTIVAFATSLPELATSIVAALKKNVGIVMGNVLGSNIINILIVLGTTAVIKPISMPLDMNVEIVMVMLANIALLLAVKIGHGLHLSRREGGVLLALYLGFLVFSVYFN